MGNVGNCTVDVEGGGVGEEVGCDDAEFVKVNVSTINV
jgi:hypothetical protein